MYYINSFFIYSMLGYIFEYIMNKVLNNKSGSGILYGFWTPIYGVGAVIILLLYKYFFNMNTLFIFKLLLFLISVIIILTLLEWVAGVIIEKVFKITFWDYRRLKYNFGKYISFYTSLLWAFFSLIVVFIIQPLINNFIYLIPKYITYILIILMLLDFTIILKKGKVHK